MKSDRRQTLEALVGVGALLLLVAYTIWSVVTERQIGGYVIRMQAWGDEGRYGVNYSWVLTLVIGIGLVAAVLATGGLVRALILRSPIPLSLRPASRAKRMRLALPAAIAFALSACVALYLLVEGREAAVTLGWLTKLALFALPVVPLAWVALAEGLAPAGWHQGRVTGRNRITSDHGEATHYVDIDGRRYHVSPEDHARAAEGSVVGVLHTGGLLGLTIQVRTDLADDGGPQGPPMTF